MKILVTGGTGFTGKALVRRLLDDGHSVIALDYKEGLKTQELREWGAKVVIGSVTDPDVLREHIPGVEVVHHLAAAFREMNVAESYYDEVNVEGTRVVLDAAHREGVKKFVYCSTCGVHGNCDVNLLQHVMYIARVCTAVICIAREPVIKKYQLSFHFSREQKKGLAYPFWLSRPYRCSYPLKGRQHSHQRDGVLLRYSLHESRIRVFSFLSLTLNWKNH